MLKTLQQQLQEKEATDSFFTLEAELDGKPVAIEFTVDDSEPDVVGFDGVLTGVGFQQLGDLASLVGGDVDFDFLPDEIPLLDNLVLSQIYCQLNATSKKPQAIGLAIGLRRPWVIIDEVFAFEQIVLVLSIYYPDASGEPEPGAGSKPTVIAELSGVVNLGGYLLNAMLTDSSVIIQSAPAESLDIRYVLSHFLPSAAEWMPELALTQLYIELDYVNKTFTFDAIVVSDWTIGPVDLTMVALSISGGRGQSPSGSFSAELQLGEVALSVTAFYVGAGAGWLFDGSATFTDALGLGNLLSPFGIDESKIPSAINALKVKEIAISFDTDSKDFDLNVEGELSLGSGKEAAVTLTLALVHQPAPEQLPSGAGSGTAAAKKSKGSYDISFSGQLTLDELEFELIFERTTTHAVLKNPKASRNHAKKSTLLAARYKSRDGISVAKLLGSFGVSNAPADFKLTEALFAYQSGSRYLLAANANVDFNLSGLGNLPLVGKAFKGEETLAINVAPWFTKGDFSQDTEALSALLPPSIPPLAPASKPGDTSPKFDFTVTIDAGGTHYLMSLGGEDKESVQDDLGVTKDPQTTTDTPPDPSDNKDVTWIDVDKTFADIVHVGRIGLGLKDSEITALLDAELTIAGALTLGLYGLGAKYNLKSHDVSFALQGMGLDFKRPPVEIGAFFLKLTDAKTGETDFVGRATIRTKTFGLSALGAFSQIKDKSGKKNPSLFIYGFLDYPIGGPVFFFVEGLAAGFGFNRALTLPPLDRLNEFPPIKEAIEISKGNKGAARTGDVQNAKETVRKELEDLHQYISPAIGQYFLAVGIKFNSFRLIDTFALVTMSLQLKALEVNLHILAVSQLVLPPRSPKVLAVIELAIEGDINPREGHLLIHGELTRHSWIISPDSTIEGGYARGFWMLGPHMGDFVETLGGYHPRFDVPKHYPWVKPLEFAWDMNGFPLEIKGGCYFAITPIALMAGGHVSGDWHKGPVKASFKLRMDFLIQWKPFHYDIEIHLEVTAKAPVIGTKHIGADLRIWGPEFSGTAHFKAGPISIKIDFGPDRKRDLPPIDWSEFKTSFLPHGDVAKGDELEILSVSVASGLIKTLQVGTGPDAVEWWVINPKEFALDINTTAPLTKIMTDDAAAEETELATVEDAYQQVGIAPMDVGTATASTLMLTLQHEGDSAEHEFAFTPLAKTFPAGLWGQGRQITNGRLANKDQKRLVDGIGRVTVVSGRIPVPGETRDILRKHLDYVVYPARLEDDPAQDVNGVAYEALDYRKAEKRTADRQTLKGNWMNPAVTNARNAVLMSLGISPAASVSLSEGLSDAFIVAPQMVTSVAVEEK